MHLRPRLKPLRRHVSHRAHDVAGVGHVVGVDGLCQAEVGDPDVAASIQEQVRRLDVAMEDSLCVRMGQSIGNLDADPPPPRAKPRSVSESWEMLDSDPELGVTGSDGSGC